MPSLGELVAPRRLGADFRWLLASSWTSNVGDGIALSAAPLLIASMTTSPLLVAAGAILQYLPWLLFGLLAGSVADHHDRRRLVMIANASRAVVVAGLVGIACFGTLEARVSFATLMRVCLSLEVLMHLAFALTTTPAAAFMIMFGFGAYAFVWGTISTTVRQRLVPMALQGRIASVNMVGVFGGLVIGQFLGGLIAQTWGLTAPWWFAFGGSALTLLLVWRSISHIAAAKPVLGGEPVQSSKEP